MVPFKFGGVTWGLSAGGGFPYTYVLSNERYRLRLAEHMQPRLHVQFMSEALWDLGPKEALREVREIIGRAGLRETRPASVSRVDWCFDFALRDIDFTEEHFLSKARKDAKHRGGGQTETFIFGRGDVLVRIYDKVKEIAEVSGKTWLFDLWGQNEGVWRIEAQARRAFLKQHGIRTPEDLFMHQGFVAHWIVDKHTTLRVPTGDSNRSRWPLHPLWDAVQAAARDMEGQEQGYELDLERPLAAALDDCLKSMEGMAKNYAAIVTMMNDYEVGPFYANDNEAVPDLEQTFAMIKSRLERRVSPQMWENDVKTRRNIRRFGK
ncbi:MAG: hypothetical protein ACPG1C_03090 [Alphaproteobacteria bacterium]